ncbi:GM20001 [Drosophila sechellia]|uniref:GM20001 n=1 Tax=Drosophila sechellia TaxID=7238 RepID=B4HMI6_DROSE|nr:GM26713 [Drosophila sechellia]EDW48254.1 GM20001 [Drosophila sechellia]
MASSMDLLCLLGILIISSMLLETSALDSEVVESVTGASKSSNFSENVKIKLDKTWSPNGTMLAQPYNILETNCPHGYVLANKHCHKRA